MSERIKGEGGGTGQTLREVLEELDRRSRGKSASTSLEIRASEDIPRALQETTDGVRQEQILRSIEEVSEGARQQELKTAKPTEMPGAATRIAQVHDRVRRVGRAGGRYGIGPRSVDVYRSGEYWQRTKITGVNPMDMPGVAARIAQVHDRVRRAAGAGRRHIIGPRSVDVYRSGEYWQKTEITGKVPQDTFKDTTDQVREDEPTEPCRNVNQISAVSALVSGFGNLTWTAQENRKRVRLLTDGQPSEEGLEEQSQKRARRASGGRCRSPERNASQEEEVAAIMRALEEEFEEKERQSYGRLWCEPIPHERKVATVREFYNAFHEVKTLPIQTCTICYRKFAIADLEEFGSTQSMSADFHTRYGSQFSCCRCFASRKIVLRCAECIRDLERGVLSPAAHVHSWLRCEHAYPDELKDLSPVKEKLIALNSCYGFITKYNVVKGHRESATYPKHVKGHITVFPNNVQELVTRVLPHPLLKVMDEIHVSWQGAEKPAPKDLSILLSVRRRAVERALMWLKRNNPHYTNIEINTTEMESWGAPFHGVPPQVYERLEHDEPSAWEKTRTAQLVPPTERGLEAGDDVDVREILATLNQPQAVRHGEMEEGGIVASSGCAEVETDVDGSGETVQEISASGMFALDALPDVEDTEKLRYLYDALGRKSAGTGSEQGRWTASAEV